MTRFVRPAPGEALAWDVSTLSDGRVRVMFGPVANRIELVLTDRDHLLRLVDACGAAEEAASSWATCDRCGRTDCDVVVSSDGELARHSDCT